MKNILPRLKSTLIGLVFFSIGINSIQLLQEFNSGRINTWYLYANILFCLTLITGCLIDKLAVKETEEINDRVSD